ncbi:hypothetical protein PR048_011419 [Dryococelus australis]|uniref:Uncharacterized protein n=1 Tax=Dryococelus australis TaxID=614101 RepID=A0ABQ9HLI1_9NEOP|nr:hypothetical protein PR048_011419 [Dryococelus australis]
MYNFDGYARKDRAGEEYEKKGKQDLIMGKGKLSNMSRPVKVKPKIPLKQRRSVSTDCSSSEEETEIEQTGFGNGSVAPAAMLDFPRQNARAREIPEKTRRPAASYGKIPTCENPGVTRPGIKPEAHVKGGKIADSNPQDVREMVRGHTAAPTLASMVDYVTMSVGRMDHATYPSSGEAIVEVLTNRTEKVGFRSIIYQPHYQSYGQQHILKQKK